MKKTLHILETGVLTHKPKQVEWQANDKDCERLADRIGVIKVTGFSAHFTAERDNLICVKGKIEAEVIQSCVVSGEPVSESINEEFEEFFTDNKRYKQSIEIDMDSPDITPVENNRIDLEELATQYLILALNPYPHKKDIVFEDKIEDDEKPNPFAVLEKLKH